MTRKTEPLRAAIVRRVKERGLTTYRLAKELDGKVTRKTLDNYLSGRHNAADWIEDLMGLLDLRVVESKSG